MRKKSMNSQMMNNSEIEMTSGNESLKMVLEKKTSKTTFYG